MKEFADNVHIFWEVLGLPLLIAIGCLLAFFWLTLWVDYQRSKQGGYK